LVGIEIDPDEGKGKKLYGFIKCIKSGQGFCKNCLIRYDVDFFLQNSRIKYGLLLRILKKREFGEIPGFIQF